MATGLDFSGIARFDPHSDPTSLSTRWNDWIKRFTRFIVAMDIVLMQQAKRDKFSTRYEPNPYQVISVKGTQVTAERSGLQRTRHISYFKPYHGSCDQGLAERSSESDEDEDISDPQPPLQPPPAVERRYPARQRERPRYYVEER